MPWLLPLTFDSPDYTFNDMALSMISASASLSPEGIIHVSIVNIDPDTTCDLSIELRGTDAGSVKGRILTAEKINSLNTFEDSERIRPVEFNDASLSKGVLDVRMPSKSIVVLEIK